MIKNITGQGHITVTGTSSSGPHISPGAVGAGMIRWNSNMQQLEVNDGLSWIGMHSSYPTVALSYQADQAVTWAIQKMEQEQRIAELAKKHPAVQDLKEKLDIILALVQQEETGNGTR